jgi:hypothetical protein
MLIKIENGLPVGYPILEDNFRHLNPTSVFPLILTNAIVESFGYAMYDFSPVPANRWDQKLVEVTPIKDEYGIYRQQWQVLDLAGQELEDRITTRIKDNLISIDRDVDAIYGSVLGNRSTEYQLAEQDAQNYARAGYEGTVPQSVLVWAQVKDWTTIKAADDILLQAAQWRTAQATIRATRLQHKETVRVSKTVAGQNTVMNSWSQFIVVLKTQLGI